MWAQALRRKLTTLQAPLTYGFQKEYDAPNASAPTDFTGKIASTTVGWNALALEWQELINDGDADDWETAKITRRTIKIPVTIRIQL